MNYQPETIRVRDLKLNDKVYSNDDIQNMIEGLKAIKLSVNNNGEYSAPIDMPQLSVVALNKEQYVSIALTNKYLSNAIYLVESDNIDAFGNTVVNVGDPVVQTDAANKKYVDNIILLNLDAQLIPICFVTDKQHSAVLHTDIQWSEFILAKSISELAESNAIDSNLVFLNSLTLLANTNFNDELGPVYAEIVNPGQETDVSRFLPITSGTSINDAICKPGAFMTFKFENVLLDINTKYVIKFINKNTGLLQNINVLVMNVENLKTKTFNESNPSAAYLESTSVFISMINVANTSNIATSLIMPDCSSSNLYSVYIENGKIICEKE